MRECLVAASGGGRHRGSEEGQGPSLGSLGDPTGGGSRSTEAPSSLALHGALREAELTFRDRVSSARHTSLTVDNHVGVQRGPWCSVSGELQFSSHSVPSSPDPGGIYGVTVGGCDCSALDDVEATGPGS